MRLENVHIFTLLHSQCLPAPPGVVESFCGGIVRVKCELFTIQAQDLAPTNGYLAHVDMFLNWINHIQGHLGN